MPNIKLLFLFQRIVIKPNEIRPGASNLTIINCDTIQIQSGAINKIGSLRTVNIHNVKRLELQEKSFQWAGDGMPPLTGYNMDFPRLSIHISNTNIPDVSRYAFNGNIRKISMDNVYIGKIQHFAFSSLNGMEKLEFKNTVVNNIQVQGFKKFTTNSIMIENTTFNSDLVSRTFSDIEVRVLFRISQSHLKTIKPSAFILNKPLKVEVTDSHFNQLDGESFKINVLGEATFRDNSFGSLQSGAFIGITAERTPKLDFIFANNYINELQDRALEINTTGFDVKFYTINLNITCSCENIVKWTSMLYNSDTNVLHCLNDNKNWNFEMINAQHYSAKHCGSTRTFKTFVYVTTALIISIVILVIVYFYLRSRYQRTHKKQWINNASPLAQRKNFNNKNNTLKCINGKLPMVVPDGRTYRETVVVVESADLLTTDL